jgi:hypothetical protein
VNPAWDTIPFFPLAFMMLSFGTYTCEMIHLPPFQPNEYLFETFKDKGEEKWEIYAWAMREIIAEVGNFKKSD